MKSLSAGLRLDTLAVLRLTAFALLLSCALAAAPAAQEKAAGKPADPQKTSDPRKITVTKLDELPRHTYAISGSASELLQSREAILSLAAQVKKDTEEILQKYEIADRNTLQGLYGALQGIAFLEGNEAKVLEYLEKTRALEDKESNRLTQGLVAVNFFAARRETGKPIDSPEFKASFRAHLAADLAVLPWAVIQDNAEQMKGNAEMLSEAMLIGMVQGTMDPAVAKSGQLSRDLAVQLLSFRGAMDTFLPLKDEVASVIGERVNANRVEKVDIWASRNVVLDPGDKKVLVAIWDTGVDVSVFPDRMWTNTREELNGKDDDGNGFIDDRHGIAFDRMHEHSPVLLYPLGEAESKRGELEANFKGLFDLQAALDTPESAAFKRAMAGLKPEEVSPFLEDLSLYTHHAHGTHVTGIALEGNPRAEVLAARLGTDHHMIPDPPTMELTEKLAREFQQTVDYFKAAGVRVVNMSWVMAAKGLEDDLEKNGIGKDQEERARMAREMFPVAREGLRRAFESAPEILFVGGAGNSDNDVDFDEFIPPAFELDNLLIAGAVDQAGDATDFTSFGRGVDVYSNGFEVDSFVPGGHRMELSGTSMASPNVVNLAAKLIALDPSLTPAQVIDLIEKGAEPRGKDGALLVIHPQRSVELLKTRG